MSLSSKVMWKEGLFLSPQHFQQQERYIEQLIEGKCSGFGPYYWGIQEVEIDSQLLKLGKISVTHAKGVFPDGTPFNFPDANMAPAIIDVPTGTHNTVVYLAIPLRRAGAVDVSEPGAQGYARHFCDEQLVRSTTEEGSESLSVDVAKLQIKLLTEKDDLSGYACIGIIKIAESREDKDVLLNDDFIPTCLDCQAAPKLHGFLTELVGLLHHRGESIAGRLADTQRGGTAEIADYMMLQMINRIEPLGNHLANLKGLHPLALFTELVQMIGELSTFVAKNKRPPAFPPYMHDNLQSAFLPVMSSLRQCLSMVYEQSAISLQLVEKKYGIRVSEIADRSMLSSGSYVLAVRADATEEIVRTRFPAQLKIGPVERIRQLVNAAMPGIPIKPLPVAPRQIPFRSGYVYFELEKQTPLWKELQNSGGFAMHVGGDFPGLDIEFWAVRQ